MAVGTYALTTLSNLKNWIGITSVDDDVLLEDGIDRATAIIESYCDRRFKSRTYYEWCDGGGEKTLTVKNRPITAVNTVSFGSKHAMTVSSDTSSTDVLATISNDGDELRLHKVASDGTTTTDTLAFSTYATTSALVTQINFSVSGWSASLAANAYSRAIYRFAGRGILDVTGTIEVAYDNMSGYRVDFDSGEINIGQDAYPTEFIQHKFPRGFQPVFVEYVAGYSTIPADLEQVCIEIAADLYRERKQDKTITSESLGDYSYTQAGVSELLAGRVEKLGQYREIR